MLKIFFIEYFKYTSREYHNKPHVSISQLQQLLTIVNCTPYTDIYIAEVLIKSQKYLKPVWLREEILIFILLAGVCAPQR